MEKLEHINTIGITSDTIRAENTRRPIVDVHFVDSRKIPRGMGRLARAPFRELTIAEKREDKSLSSKATIRTDKYIVSEYNEDGKLEKRVEMPIKPAKQRKRDDIVPILDDYIVGYDSNFNGAGI